MCNIGFDPAKGSDYTVTTPPMLAAPKLKFELLDEIEERNGIELRIGLLNGERVRVFGPGEHPITKERFPMVVERVRDFAIFGLK